MEQSTLLAQVEIFLNRLLANNAHLSTRLDELHTKVVQFKTLSLTCYLVFFNQEIHLYHQWNKPVDVFIEASPQALAKMAMLTNAQREHFIKNNFHITGDMEVAQLIKQYVNSLEIDWESWLAQYTSKPVAHKIVTSLISFNQLTKQWKTHFTESFSEFLQEESSLLPSNEEIQDFCEDVDTLRMNCDRLEAKLKQYLDNDE